jgi:sugar phosphate isomerase/epimerase
MTQVGPIGILTTTFPDPSSTANISLESTLDVIAAHKLAAVQFDLSCAGLPSMPDAIDPASADLIRAALAARSIDMAALSGTFNMIHPDPAVRDEGLRRLEVMASACARLGTQVITLCSGTRDTASMWRRHPDNDTPEAWRDLLDVMGRAVRIAEERNVTLAFEPEVNNAADSAQKARALIDAFGSPRLKVVMDGANIFHTGELPRMREILTEAFELLGDHIALAHAKDLDHDGDAGHLPAGHGLLDYALYMKLLKQSSYAGPLVLHGLRPDQIDGCAAFLRTHLGDA